MGRGKPVEFGSWKFPTQSAAEQAVRDIVNAHDFMEEFESNLISELAATRHPSISKFGLRPTKFRKAPHPDHPGTASYEFQGFFPAMPGEREIGWRDFSWKACIKDRTPWDDVTGALRRLAKPRMDRERKAACEQCGTSNLAARLDVDHVNPTFEEMVTPLRPLISDKEALSYRNWKENDRYTLPLDHAVVVAFLKVHETGELQTLCRPCHMDAGNARKTQT